MNEPLLRLGHQVKAAHHCHLARVWLGGLKYLGLENEFEIPEKTANGRGQAKLHDLLMETLTKLRFYEPMRVIRPFKDDIIEEGSNVDQFMPAGMKARLVWES